MLPQDGITWLLSTRPLERWSKQRPHCSRRMLFFLPASGRSIRIRRVSTASWKSGAGCPRRLSIFSPSMINAPLASGLAGVGCVIPLPAPAMPWRCYKNSGVHTVALPQTASSRPKHLRREGSPAGTSRKFRMLRACRRGAYRREILHFVALRENDNESVRDDAEHKPRPTHRSAFPSPVIPPDAIGQDRLQSDSVVGQGC